MGNSQGAIYTGRPKTLPREWKVSTINTADRKKKQFVNFSTYSI